MATNSHSQLMASLLKAVDGIINIIPDTRDTLHSITRMCDSLTTAIEDGGLTFAISRAGDVLDQLSGDADKYEQLTRDYIISNTAKKGVKTIVEDEPAELSADAIKIIKYIKAREGCPVPQFNRWIRDNGLKPVADSLFADGTILKRIDESKFFGPFISLP